MALNDKSQLSIYYVLSESFDYGRMICDDAGPGYVQRHGWLTVPLSAAKTIADKPHVFDNRLANHELATLVEHAVAFPDSPLFIKVVDPDFEKVSQPYYQQMLALAAKPNVELVGPYQRTGITSLACSIAGRDLYHFLPYAYDATREQPLASVGISRKRKLLFSGRLGVTVYPDRWRFYKAQAQNVLGMALCQAY